MKKFLAILCALTLMLGCMAIPAQAEELAPAHLKVWMMGTVDQKDSDLVWAAYNEELQKALPNTTVEFYLPSDYASAYNMAMASGEQIDLAWTGWTHDIEAESKLGNLLPLDDLVREYAPGIIETLTIELLDMHRVSDGKLYQVPSYQGLSGNTCTYFPMEVVETMREGWIEDYASVVDAYNSDAYYNDTLTLQQKLISLYEEYIEAAAALGKLGVLANPNNFPTILGGSTGAKKHFDIDPKTLQVKSMFDGVQKDVRKMVYGAIGEWYEKGWVPTDVVSLMETSNTFTTWSGGVSSETVLWAGDSFADNLQSVAERNALKTKSDIVAFQTRKAPFSELGNATGMSVPYTAKNPERAVMLMNEMYVNKPLYDLWVYGIEGTHYTKNEDGTYTTLCGDGQATSDWAYGQWKWTFGSCMLSAQTQTESTHPVDTLRLDMENLKIAFNRKLHTWNFDPANVESEYSNIQVIRDEYEQQLKCGILGKEGAIAAFEAMCDEIYAAGYDKVLAEAQRQVDEACAARGITSLGEEFFDGIVRDRYVIVRYADLAK